MNFRILLASAALALSACEQAPRAYPLPQQEPQFAGFKTHSVRVLNMADADAPSHFLRDIQPDLHVSWRWAMQRPAVKIKVHDPANLIYTIDFAVPEITFHDTGPVEISFTVNDRLLDSMTCDHPGPYHFEKAVPAGWIPTQAAGSEAVVGAEIDKLWTSSLDGAQFGFIVSRIGLEQPAR